MEISYGQIGVKNSLSGKLKLEMIFWKLTTSTSKELTKKPLYSEICSKRNQFHQQLK